MNIEFLERKYLLPEGDAILAAANGQMGEQTLLICLCEKGRVSVSSLDTVTIQYGPVQFQKDIAEHLDLEKPIELVQYQHYLAAYNVKGLTGVVIDLNDSSFLLPLEREDYHCNLCSWPIGFATLDQQITLIHSTQWNRIDFTQLPSGKLLTERVVKFFKDKENINYLDYFHSQLYVAPDQEHFVVNGWHWAPFDQIWSWNIKQFLTEYELAGRGLSVIEVNGYNWDRPLCFVDNQTIAWAINTREAGSDVAPDTAPTELIFQDITTDKKIVNRMKFENFDLTSEKEVSGRLWFDRVNRLFIASAEEKGTTVTDESGQPIWHRPVKTDFANPDIQTIGMIESGTVNLLSWR